MILLQNKTNVTAPSSTWPFGKIKDDTGSNDGTPVDEQVYQDQHQFFSKLFAASGITANNLPDNFDNSFQLYEALIKHIVGDILAGHVDGAWVDGGTDLDAAALAGGGSITIDAADVAYNKWKLQGRTLLWQVRVKNFTVTGTVNAIGIPLPATLLAAYKFANQTMRLGAVYNTINNNLIVSTGADEFYFPEDVSWLVISPTSGTFSTGSNTQFMDINIVAELTTL